MGNLSLHFSESEFRCNCCGQVKVDNSLIYLLEAIREHFNKPVVITSGYRCPVHNKNIDGVSGSKHLTGQAADIIIKGINPRDVYIFANSINKNGGLGNYSNFTHIDTCISPPHRRWIG